MHPISYRRVLVEDFPYIVALLNKYLSFGLANEANLQNIINSAYSYCALHDGNIVGFISSGELIDHEKEFLGNNDFINIIQEKQGNKQLIVIRQLVVDPNFRHRGTGTKLLDKVLASNTNNGFCAIGWVTPKGWEAEGIFKKKGFEPLAEAEDFWGIASNCPYCSKGCSCLARLCMLI
jgi:N-acetylglutamate synthase-like GNAT family acetyltransferase